MNYKLITSLVLALLVSSFGFSQGFSLQAMPQASYQMQITPVKTTFQYGGGMSLGWEWKRYHLHAGAAAFAFAGIEDVSTSIIRRSIFIDSEWSIGGKDKLWISAIVLHNDYVQHLRTLETISGPVNFLSNTWRYNAAGLGLGYRFHPMLSAHVQYIHEGPERDAASMDSPYFLASIHVHLDRLWKKNINEKSN
jgi:hypothetical protein